MKNRSPSTLAYQHEHHDIISSYQNCDAAMRVVMLTALKDESKKPLYDHYFLELDNAIKTLATANEYHARLARRVYKKVKQAHESILQKSDLTKIDDTILFDVLHKTAALISTPILNDDHTINPDFEKSKTIFVDSITRMKSNARTNAIRSVGYALVSALTLAASVLITIFTFGSATPAALGFEVVALGLINIGGELGLGIYTGAKAFKFFNEAYKVNSMANEMRKLGEEIRAPENDFHRSSVPL